MSINKQELVRLFSCGKYDEIKNEISKSKAKNKNEIINLINEVLDNLKYSTQYDAIVNEYGKEDTEKEIKRKKNKLDNALRIELEKLE